MKPWLLLVLALVVPSASAQDTVAVARDLDALRVRGVRAEIRSKTTKRNPENGRSMLAMVEAYTKGIVADASGELVFFLSDENDEAWVRTNSVALVERADTLIALLERAGAQIPALRALNEKWFPAVASTDDPESIVARERAMKQMGMPISIGMASFPVSEDGAVNPTFGVKNLSDLVIESLHVEMIAFSPHGDVVRDRDSELATQSANLIAVISPGDTALFKFEEAPLWINRMTDCVEIRKVEVRFRDGTVRSIDYSLPDARPLPTAFHVMGECSHSRS